MEELAARHKKEQRDLQAKITQKKKNATKKTRKGVNDECERLQQELDEQQRLEIIALDGENGADQREDHDVPLGAGEKEEKEVPNNCGMPATNNDCGSQVDASVNSRAQSSHPMKSNRQKARLARRAADRVRQSEIAAEEAAKQTDHRGNEKEAMESAFKRLGLHEIDITPDGHCLYSAIAYQLDEKGLGLRPDPERINLSSATLSRINTVSFPKHDGYRAVRAVTADFINEHSEDFVPFMEESLDEYTRKIKLTAEWGGQLEIQAISRAYGIEINVLQQDGDIINFEPGDINEWTEEDSRRRKLWLAYYRHTYGLGEHYNALEQRS